MADWEKYDKKNPREHVLLRPDTYVGDIEPTEEEMWVFSEEKKYLEKKKITYVPGLYKIYDEVLVNARDHSVNDTTCNTIKIWVNADEGYIKVMNNGDNGIPVVQHEKHKMLVPTMIFGDLMSGSNFDDTVKRTTGGKNGLGAKLGNIFSTSFNIEIQDGKNKKHFNQTWLDNMSSVEPAQVTKQTGKSFTQVTFHPDLKRFKIKEFGDHISLFKKRAYDLAAVTDPRVKVYFNDEKVEIPHFKKYMDLFYPEAEKFYDDSNSRLQVGCIYQPNQGGETISYVNGICTWRGGSHVNYVTDVIIKKLISDFMKKKDKELSVSPMYLKENLVFFINAEIDNPAFSSQTKDTLTTKTDNFGTGKYNPPDLFLKKIAKSGLVDQVLELAKFKENAGLKKTDGKKTVTLRGVPKLEDANKAGGSESTKCALILTEGDSAKAFAMAGLGIIGNDYYGVFPLKGKPLNVREATTTQLSDNEEINNLKKILGLKHTCDLS
jgi:DNA topoisomerase-2